MKRRESLATITPAKAQKLLACNNYPGQRTLSLSHAFDLAEKMGDGRFHVGSIAVIHTADRDYLGDGQHQCTASVNWNKTFRAVLQEFFVEEGDTEDDVARIFSQFNVDRSRSRGDIAWIYGVQIGWGDWPKKAVSLCNTAIGWLESGCLPSGTVKMTRDANAALMRINKEVCEFAKYVVFDNGPAKHLMRAPTMAAIIATARKDRDAANEFWAAVRNGELLVRTDPQWKIREYLMRVVIRGARGDACDQREVFVKCIHAWNAYRKGGSTDLKYHADKPIPDIK